MATLKKQYCASYRAKEHTLATTQQANIILLKVDQQDIISSLKFDQRDNIASLKVDLKTNYRDQLKDKLSRLLSQKDTVIRDLKSEGFLLKQAAMKAEMKCTSAKSYARECLKQTTILGPPRKKERIVQRLC